MGCYNYLFHNCEHKESASLNLIWDVWKNRIHYADEEDDFQEMPPAFSHQDAIVPVHHKMEPSKQFLFPCFHSISFTLESGGLVQTRLWLHQSVYSSIATCNHIPQSISSQIFYEWISGHNSDLCNVILLKGIMRVWIYTLVRTLVLGLTGFLCLLHDLSNAFTFNEFCPYDSVVQGDNSSVISPLSN